MVGQHVEHHLDRSGNRRPQREVGHYRHPTRAHPEPGDRTSRTPPNPHSRQRPSMTNATVRSDDLGASLTYASPNHAVLLSPCRAHPVHPWRLSSPRRQQVPPRTGHRPPGGLTADSGIHAKAAAASECRERCPENAAPRTSREEGVCSPVRRFGDRVGGARLKSENVGRGNTSHDYNHAPAEQVRPHRR